MARGKLIIETLFEFNPERKIKQMPPEDSELQFIYKCLDDNLVCRKGIEESIEQLFQVIRNDILNKDGQILSESKKSGKVKEITPVAEKPFFYMTIDPDR